MSEPVLNVSSMFGFGSGLPGAIWMYSERRPDVQCLLGTFPLSRGDDYLGCLLFLNSLSSVKLTLFVVGSRSGQCGGNCCLISCFYLMCCVSVCDSDGDIDDVMSFMQLTMLTLLSIL